MAKWCMLIIIIIICWQLDIRASPDYLALPARTLVHPLHFPLSKPHYHRDGRLLLKVERLGCCPSGGRALPGRSSRRISLPLQPEAMATAGSPSPGAEPGRIQERPVDAFERGQVWRHVRSCGKEQAPHTRGSGLSKGPCRATRISNHSVRGSTCERAQAECFEFYCCVTARAAHGTGLQPARDGDGAAVRRRLGTGASERLAASTHPGGI
eukprot:scaffold910_cov115-Isochrysis_galbana.AAC.2